MGHLNDSNQLWNFAHQQFSKDVGEYKVMTLGQQAKQKALQEGIYQGVQETTCRTRSISIDEIKKPAKKHH